MEGLTIHQILQASFRQALLDLGKDYTVSDTKFLEQADGTTHYVIVLGRYNVAIPIVWSSKDDEDRTEEQREEFAELLITNAINALDVIIEEGRG